PAKGSRRTPPTRSREAIGATVPQAEPWRSSPARAPVGPRRSNNTRRVVRPHPPRPSPAPAPGRSFFVPNTLTIGRFPPPRPDIDHASQNPGGHRLPRDPQPIRFPPSWSIGKVPATGLAQGGGNY